MAVQHHGYGKGPPQQDTKPDKNYFTGHKGQGAHLCYERKLYKSTGHTEGLQHLIISGIPGIGKTTLAKMLVLHYLRSDYEFIDVSYDINEAYTVPEHHLPRVYLYDNFSVELPWQKSSGRMKTSDWSILYHRYGTGNIQSLS